MLTDTRIVAYYASITRYWTDRQDTAQYNVEQEFAAKALELHEQVKRTDDTPQNRAMFDAENAAYAAYQMALQRVKAGIVTQSVADDALDTFKAAKEARRARIPSPDWLTERIAGEADSFRVRMRAQWDSMQDDNSEMALIVATRMVEYAADFARRLKLYIEQANALEEEREYAGDSIAPPSGSLESYGMFYDGNYGREINRVSPEGLRYGDTGWIQEIKHPYWWNGRNWLEIPDVLDQANDPSLLPADKPFGEIWRVRRYVSESNEYVWDYYLSEGDGRWVFMRQYADVQGISALPSKGYRIGDWHNVIELDVPYYWDGENIRRYRLDMFAGSQRIDSLEDLTGDFIGGLQPDIELIYISSQELSLRPIGNDFDFIRVNGQNIEASKRTSVFTFTPVLGWNAKTGSLYWSTLQPDTEYYVYLANRSDGFNIAVYDFRGRLFCSGTAPVNGQLGHDGLAENAILIGRAETDAAGAFRYELDVSLISRQSDLKETFREFSDFDLHWVDQTRLALERFYGAYGQIYVPESLYYLGGNVTVYNTDSRIEMDDAENLVYTDALLTPSTGYYVYIGGNTDIYNFNDLNPATNRPWHAEDDGSEEHYVAAKDFRLRLFLSTKIPEDGRLSQSYYGFWARHLGQVEVDSLGYFKYTNDISAIRSMILNPTDFSGLAECSMQTVSNTQFRIFRKPGTSGKIYVNGFGVQTLDVGDEGCHALNTTDPVYDYDETDIESPLGDSDRVVGYYKGTPTYIYLANNYDHWGGLREKLFASRREPVSGYLSQNWPGISARWILTIQLPVTGLFTGSYIVNSIMGSATGIDDFRISVNTTYSSQKIQDSFPPPGTVCDFAGPTPPSGWLICNGQSVAAASYPALFAVIGYTYGGGGASFNVPNLNSRTTIGYDGRWAMGAVVGAETHALTNAEMPSHDHGGVTGGHTITTRNAIGSSGGYGAGEGYVWNYFTHSHTISSDGGSQPHNTMQPSMCLWKIIKY